jgi:hypothetical protein
MAAEHNLMSDDLLRQIISVGRVDLLVGTPHGADPQEARDLVRAARACFRTHFPRQRAALLAVEGTVADTPSLVRHCWQEETLGRDALRTMHLMTATAPLAEIDAQMPRLLFAAADLLQARAVVFVDAGTIELAPERIAALAAPLADDTVDLVAPLHPLAADAGLLVTQLVRPLTRGMFGPDIAEPLLPAFGASARLAAHCVQLDVSVNRPQWIGRYWITAEALARPFVVTQQPLGPRRTAAPRSGAGFAVLFKEVMHAVFASLDAHAAEWLCNTAPTPVPLPAVSPAASPGAPERGTELLAAFEADLKNLHEILARILRADTLAALHAAAVAVDPGPRLPETLWAGVVAEFLVAYRHNVILREHVIQALLPLYMARAGTFLFEHGGSDGESLETAIESLGHEFERIKPQIVERWSEPAMR